MTIQFDGFGHVNIVVQDVAKASRFYENLFGAVPIQEFPHFRNRGFAKSAGFLDHPDEVDCTIRFLEISDANLFIELMQYHHPTEGTAIPRHETNALGGPRHICLRVKDVDAAFASVAAADGTRFINDSTDYKPLPIDAITPSDFYFFDSNMEANQAEKINVCKTARQTRFFYFVDPYGVQWELEEGHTDIGSTQG